MSSKYKKNAENFRNKYGNVEQKEENSFDWIGHSKGGDQNKPVFVSITQLEGEESPYDRKLRMLRQLSTACTACSMCELGLQEAVRKKSRGMVSRDPHVFSNLNPTRYMILGQNPGWKEVEARQPFVGIAGTILEKELVKNGLSRNDFYVSNALRCYSEKDISQEHIDSCGPFLSMEMNIIDPKLVVTIGRVAFSTLCPEVEYTNSLRSITRSSVYDGVPVFAVEDPESSEGTRQSAFALQIGVMCALIKKLNQNVS